MSMSFANRHDFTFFFLLWIPFISFSCLTTLARVSSIVLNRSGDSGHLCLDCDQKGKIHSSIIKYDFSCRFFIGVLHQFEEVTYFF